MILQFTVFAPPYLSLGNFNDVRNILTCYPEYFICRHKQWGKM